MPSSVASTRRRRSCRSSSSPSARNADFRRPPTATSSRWKARWRSCCFASRSREEVWGGVAQLSGRRSRSQARRVGESACRGNTEGGNRRGGSHGQKNVREGQRRGRRRHHACRARSMPRRRRRTRSGSAMRSPSPARWGRARSRPPLSQYKLWQKRVNDAGGITLKKFNKKVPIDLVGYDDQGKPDELLKLTERLIQSDKVDMILSPYATHMNLASAPVINKYQYPVILSTSAAAQALRAGAATALRVLAPGAAERGDPADVGDDRRLQEGRQDQGPRGDDPSGGAARRRAARGFPRGGEEGRARGRAEQELSVRHARTSSR